MSTLASSEIFLSINTLGIYVFQKYRKFLSYGHPPVPSLPEKRWSSVNLYIEGLRDINAETETDLKFSALTLGNMS